jgi:hypothetical protein
MYIFLVVLGLNARFDHFYARGARRIQNMLDNTPTDHLIIVTEGNRAHVESTFSQAIADDMYAWKDFFEPQLVARNAVYINIEKHAATDAEIDNLLARLNLTRTPQMNAFINAWPVVSQKTSNQYNTALQAALTDSHRMRKHHPENPNNPT